MALGFVGAAAAHLAVVVLIVWAAFGFRYSAFSEGRPGARPPQRALGKTRRPAAAGGGDRRAQPDRGPAGRNPAPAGGPRDRLRRVDLAGAGSAPRVEAGGAHCRPGPEARCDPGRAARLPGAAPARFHRPAPAPAAGLYLRLGFHPQSDPAAGGVFQRGIQPPGLALLLSRIRRSSRRPCRSLASWGSRWRRSGRGGGASGAGTERRCCRSALDSFSTALPFGTLFAVYWAAAVTSHLNIGHRHLLPTYPPLFILGGAAAAWWTWSPDRLPIGRARRWRAAAPGLALAALLALAAAETIGRFPNYLSYFNVLAGGADHAYRHLVDSSLDWGQDLPAAQRYLAAHPRRDRFTCRTSGSPVPRYYGIAAAVAQSPASAAPELHNCIRPGGGRDRGLCGAHTRTFDVVAVARQGAQESVMLLERPEALRLKPGTYLISATMLQWGPWDPHYEDSLPATLQGGAAAGRSGLERRMAALRGRDPAAWTKHPERFQSLPGLAFGGVPARPGARGNDQRIDPDLPSWGGDLRSAFEGPAPESVADPRVSGPGQPNPAEIPSL